MRILRTLLEASLAGSSGLELDRAISEHRKLIAQSRERQDGRARVRRRLPDAADPSGEIRVRRLGFARYRVSPGLRNMISGTTQAGETLSR